MSPPSYLPYTPYGAYPTLLYQAAPSTAPSIYAPNIASLLDSSSTLSWDQAASLSAMNNFAAHGDSGNDLVFDFGASYHMSALSNMMSSCSSPLSYSSIIIGMAPLSVFHALVTHVFLPLTAP